MLAEIQENLPIFKLALTVSALVHFPVAGLMIWGMVLSLFSLAGRQRGQNSELLARAVPGRGSSVLLLLLILLNVFSLWMLYQPPFFAVRFLSLPLIFLLFGIFGFVLFRYHFSSFSAEIWTTLAGAGGTLFLLAGYFLLIHGGSLLLFPEYWPHFAAGARTFLTWHGLLKFLQFLVLGFAIAGTVLLVLPSPDTGGRPLGRVAAAMIFASFLLWPPLLLLELIALPDNALSPGLLVLFGLSLVPAAVGCLLLRPLAAEPVAPGRSRLIPVALAILFLLWVANDHLARENALTGPTLAMAAIRAPVVEPVVAPPEEEKPVEVDGAAVFRRYCAACHAFDRRVVGPPLNEVLPKYQEDPSGLMEFIRNPVRVDPEYPPMPQLGMAEEEIRAVATYILREAGL
jgi:mono/diheme cytochrome c family protein